MLVPVRDGQLDSSLLRSSNQPKCQKPSPATHESTLTPGSSAACASEFSNHSP